MIHLIPNGGLGNQMFQYAAAKSLALRLKTDLVIDLSFLHLHGHKSWCRRYELDIFDIKAPVRNKTFKGVFSCRLKEIFEKLRWNKEKLLLFGLFADPCAFVYDSRFERLKNETALLGYFQNERYFQDYLEEIRRDFTFVLQMNEQNQAIANQISACNSVSLHIRRGDYISDKNAAQTFANLSLDYYYAAMDYIRQRIENPQFFVFTDDVEWVKAQFNDTSLCYMDINSGKNSYNDMRLMSLCKHNIIANSSFSWWGAYLNNNSEKIVIAPKNWYREEKINTPAISNLIPKQWVKM